MIFFMFPLCIAIQIGFNLITIIMITIMIEGKKKALRFTLLCQYERSSGSVHGLFLMQKM